jgi:hypothetical protein
MLTEKNAADARPVRSEWKPPVVTRLEAGSAETGGQPPDETGTIS